jgi:hypothetical protein
MKVQLDALHQLHLDCNASREAIISQLGKKTCSHIPEENGTVDDTGVRVKASSRVGARYFPGWLLADPPSCVEDPFSDVSKVFELLCVGGVLAVVSCDGSMVATGCEDRGGIGAINCDGLMKP